MGSQRCDGDRLAPSPADRAPRSHTRGTAMHAHDQADDHVREFIDALEQLASAELRADYAVRRRPAPSLADDAPAAVGILIGVRTCLAWLDELIATDSLTCDAVDGMLPVLIERTRG